MVKLKYFFLTIMLLGIKQVVLCQEQLHFSHPEQLPMYRNVKGGGLDSLLIFVYQNLRYPETALKDSVGGVVSIVYIIEEDGTTTNHLIVRGVREDINQEALRIAKMIKYDTPAKNDNQPVRSQFAIHIAFDYREELKKENRIARQRR